MVTTWLARALVVVLISAVLTVIALGLAAELAGGAFVIATLVGLAGAVAATIAPRAAAEALRARWYGEHIPARVVERQTRPP